MPRSGSSGGPRRAPVVVVAALAAVATALVAPSAISADRALSTDKPVAWGADDLAAAPIYSAPSGAFTDVTNGKNVSPQDGQESCPADAPALCEAGPGWDGPTGVGTPNGLSGF